MLSTDSWLEIVIKYGYIAGSSNGRTMDSGSINLGSNPSPAAEMIKRLWIIFKFIFENGPNVGFWIGVLYFLNTWFVKRSITIKIVIFIVPVIAIFLIIVGTFRKIKSQLLETNVESGLKERKGNANKDLVKLLIKNLPTRTNLVALYKYATAYAKSWASDGRVEEINYYLDLENNKIEKDVQIYINSATKREHLAFYLPRHSKQIEEFSQGEGSYEKNVPSIFSFKYWREAAEKALENSTSDIEKADKTRVQISPSMDSLTMNFTFEKGDREWKKHYYLKQDSLELGNTIIHKFS